MNPKTMIMVSLSQDVLVKERQKSARPLGTSTNKENPTEQNHYVRFDCKEKYRREKEIRDQSLLTDKA